MIYRELKPEEFAQWARRTLEVHLQDLDGPGVTIDASPSNVTHLMADLFHLAESEGHDIDSLIAVAKETFEQDKIELEFTNPEEPSSTLSSPLTLASIREDNLNTHDLFKEGDENIPSVIKDRNGSIILSLCKICGGGESKLEEYPCRDLIIAANKRNTKDV